MEPRIFVYIRLSLAGHLLARSKIREVAGLGSLLADFLRQAMTDGIRLPPGVELTEDVSPVMQYVDANTDQPLIGFRVDHGAQEQVIEGRIPPEYRRRMLDPEVSVCPTDRFVERAAPELPEEQKEALASWLAGSRLNLLGLIAGAMDDDGRFEVHVPLHR